MNNKDLGGEKVNQLICKRSECDSCCLKYKKDINGKKDADICYVMVSDTDKKVCPFHKNFREMVFELKYCYAKCTYPFIHSYNEYIDYLNESLNTNFYNQFKDGEISG